jgi:predicted kinase
MPKLYMLIGVPGVGKSTWIANRKWSDKTTVVSSDRYIDEEAERQGKTYDEVFNDYIKIATKMMENHVLVAQANGFDIVWDQTNISDKSRRPKLAKLPEYEKVAVFFRTPQYDVLNGRLQSRPGKAIPSDVMHRMITGLEMPTLDEGFSDIWILE